MQEASVRKLHKSMGGILLMFLSVQVITGLVFSLSQLTEPGLFQVPSWVYALHVGGGMAGSLYRVVLALLILAQGATGVAVFLLSRARMLRAKRNT